jgi:hypothetical protein
VADYDYENPDLGLSENTVKRDGNSAKVGLANELSLRNAVPIDPNIFDRPVSWERLKPTSGCEEQVEDCTLIGEPINKGGYLKEQAEKNIELLKTIGVR